VRSRSQAAVEAAVCPRLRLHVLHVPPVRRRQRCLLNWPRRLMARQQQLVRVRRRMRRLRRHPPALACLLPALLLLALGAGLHMNLLHVLVRMPLLLLLLRGRQRRLVVLRKLRLLRGRA